MKNIQYSYLSISYFMFSLLGVNTFPCRKISHIRNCTLAETSDNNKCLWQFQQQTFQSSLVQFEHFKSVTRIECSE